MRDTERERERGRDTGRGEASSMQGARLGTRSRVSRITPWAAGGTKPLSHQGCPLSKFLKSQYGFQTKWEFPEERSRFPIQKVSCLFHGLGYHISWASGVLFPFFYIHRHLEICVEKAHILFFHLEESGVGLRWTSLDNHAQEAEEALVYAQAAWSPEAAALSLARAL